MKFNEDVEGHVKWSRLSKKADPGNAIHIEKEEEAKVGEVQSIIFYNIKICTSKNIIK